jgi:hypothetical protein
MLTLRNRMPGGAASQAVLRIGTVLCLMIGCKECQALGERPSDRTSITDQVGRLADLVKFDAWVGMVSFETGTQTVLRQKAKTVQLESGERVGVPDGPLFKRVVPTTNYLERLGKEGKPRDFQIDGTFSLIKPLSGKGPPMGKVNAVVADPARPDLETYKRKPLRDLAEAVDWSEPLDHPLFFVVVGPAGCTGVLDCTLVGPFDKGEVDNLEALVKVLLINKPVAAQEERARLTNTHALVAMLALGRLEEMKEAKPQDYALAATAAAPAYSAALLRMGLKAAIRDEPFTASFLGDLKARFAALGAGRKAALVADMRLYLEEGYPPVAAALKKVFAEELAAPPAKAGDAGNKVEPEKPPPAQKPAA